MKLSQKQRDALEKLLQAIENIQLPMILKETQANTYNELMYAVTHVKVTFGL